MVQNNKGPPNKPESTPPSAPSKAAQIGLKSPTPFAPATPPPIAPNTTPMTVPIQPKETSLLQMCPMAVPTTPKTHPERTAPQNPFRATAAQGSLGVNEISFAARASAKSRS